MLLKGEMVLYKMFNMLFLTVATLAILMVTGCGGSVVATVNGEKITSAELSQRVDLTKSSMEQQGIDFSGENSQELLDSLQKSVLEEMINYKLLLQEARQLGQLTNEQVQEKIMPLKEQFPSEEEYDDFLAQLMLSEEEVAYILNLQEQVTKDVPVVPEAEVKNYYEENIEQFEQPEQVQVRHILFLVGEGDQDTPVKHTEAEAREMAEEAIAQLKQGKDFAELAREKSEDSVTKNDGGLFTFSEGEAVKEFADAANALSPGAYTQTPVKTEYGYHVIKMEKKIPAGKYSFDEVKQQLTYQLSEKAKETKFSEYMQEVRNKATIVNKLAELEGSPPNESKE
ncbi:MAG: putative peptidyl-prolyl cis-trans isomerase Cbf2 precursor [Pelotomaculum sp. PtaB.Bin104]|nr:MAG: putative peptidyl-prolyl cis-trans isomerase Cbf2 precursor [Pelotomaculum sp. PtaB.Bin104]